VRRWVIVALVASLTAAGVALVATLPEHGHSVSYAKLRLEKEQEIPGSLGVFLEPPPSGLDPSVSPERALKIAAGSTLPIPDVQEALVAVPSATLGLGAAERVITAWALFARKVCYFASKGDLVSSARSASARKELPACTRHNLSVVLVDAITGKTLAAIRGYDLSGDWAPAIASV
jgi:hypothetical protein